MANDEVITKTATGWQWDNKVNIFSVITLLVALASALFAVNLQVNLNKKDIAVAKQDVVDHDRIVTLQMATVDAKLTGIKEQEHAEAVLSAQHQTEIIRRLERIEDGTTRNTTLINSHMENSLNGYKK